MDILTFEHIGVVLSCVKKGDRPKWLIHTGTHGDEAGVIGSVEKYLESHWDEMPEFVWVRKVSPSAVERGTRVNKYGNDLNRMFRGDPESITDPEAIANLELLKLFQPFEVFISVHEDPEYYNAFYCYDSHKLQSENDSQWDEFLKKIFAYGIHAHNGLDDSQDPTLGNLIQNGYYSPEKETEDGTTFDYLYRIGRVCSRRLNPEIPGTAKPETKDFIVAAFFDYLLEWWHC
jgi:hypothetical protein